MLSTAVGVLSSKFECLNGGKDKFFWWFVQFNSLYIGGQINQTFFCHLLKIRYKKYKIEKMEKFVKWWGGFSGPAV
jgi:hypothetical protein